MYSVYAMKIFGKMNICSNVYFFLITFLQINNAVFEMDPSGNVGNVEEVCR